MLKGEVQTLLLVLQLGLEVGELLSDGIEIYSGVEPGDLVVTAGVSRIYDGLDVRMPPKPGSEPENVAPAEASEAEAAEGDEPQ